MATIAMRIERTEQMFDSLDPSAACEKALARDVESYVLVRAGEKERDVPLRLVIHAPASIREHAPDITLAVHAHFRLAHARCLYRYRRRMRLGRVGLVAGIAVLGTTLVLRTLLGGPGARPMLSAMGEGLLILGWVAMWRPAEILLFERWENHQSSALLHRLAQIPVDFELDEGAR